jgi:hypothetical protein
MNETDLLPVDPEVMRAFENVLRRMADRPDWCDHCNHGDHLPCDLWGRQGCRCPHHDTEETP